MSDINSIYQVYRESRQRPNKNSELYRHPGLSQNMTAQTKDRITQGIEDSELIWVPWWKRQISEGDFPSYTPWDHFQGKPLPLEDNSKMIDTMENAEEYIKKNFDVRRTRTFGTRDFATYETSVGETYWSDEDDLVVPTFSITFLPQTLIDLEPWEPEDGDGMLNIFEIDIWISKYKGINSKTYEKVYAESIPVWHDNAQEVQAELKKALEQWTGLIRGTEELDDFDI